MFLFYVDFISYLYKFMYWNWNSKPKLHGIPGSTFLYNKSTDIPKWLPHISFHADQVPVLQFIKEMK